MNICHRRIYKPVYYYCALVAHILTPPDRHESTTVVRDDGVYVPVRETFENRSAKQNQESSAIAH